MTAAALLAEIEARGATVEVLPGRLRVRPKRVVIDLEGEILRRADELAAAVREAPAAAPAVPVDALPAEQHVVYAFRVIVDQVEPVAGPVELRPGVQAVDVDLAIQAHLVDLNLAAARYGETCFGDRFVREATEWGERVEELIENLEKLGCRARVVGVM